MLMLCTSVPPHPVALVAIGPSPHPQGPQGPQHGRKQQEPGRECARRQMQSASVSERRCYDVHARGQDFRAGGAIHQGYPLKRLKHVNTHENTFFFY